MDPQLLDFCKDRMARAHLEQVWAVALAGAFAAFLIRERSSLVVGFRVRSLVAAAWGSGLLAALFVLSRHVIHARYDALAREVLARNGAALPHVAGTFLAGLSGLSFYLLLIVGLTIAAHRILRARTAPPRH